MEPESLIKNMARSFEHASNNIPDYDDFISSWQQFVESKNTDEHWQHTDFRQIEQFAVSALSRLVETNEHDQVSLSSNPLLHSLNSSALISNDKGQILTTNSHASRQYDVAAGSSVDALNFSLGKGMSLKATLRKLLNQEDANSQLTLLQVFTANEAMIPLAIVRLEASVKAQALIIIMDTPCSPETLIFFSAKFGLTDAESEVVSSFANGIALKKIAKLRQRSYTTIRNQFQAILEKTGCPTQVELLRLLLSISYLLSFAATIPSQESQQVETKITIKRPNNRSVDVRLYGDPNGSPIVLLPSLFGMPITKKIEQILLDRSILMIGIWRPGFGETSDVLLGDSLYQCLADDLSAVLDSRGIDQCPVLGRASAARSMFNLANLAPDRISRLCIVNSLVPTRYVSQHKKLSKWTAALISASALSPSFATLILKTGKNLMMRNGAKHFIKNMYDSSLADVEAVEDDEVASSIFEGTLVCEHQGFNAPARDMIEGFEDWSADIGKPATPIKLLQGRFDPHVPIEACRAFAAAFPEAVELVEFSDGGGLLNYTHTEAIIDIALGEEPLIHQITSAICCP